LARSLLSAGMTIASIVWGLLALGYAASTVPLFRQGFRRVPKNPVLAPGRRVVYHPSLSRARRADRSAA
jgi:hypothetical protein